VTRPKVLVATDFSNDSQLAVQQARAHAQLTGASILIVHVVQGPATVQGEGMLHDGAYADESAPALRRLLDIADVITDAPTEVRVLRGEPSDAILRAAEDANVSMIVMGTQGRTGVARVLMGSVAEQVVRNASCPVLIVKRPKDLATAI